MLMNFDYVRELLVISSCSRISMQWLQILNYENLFFLCRLTEAVNCGLCAPKRTQSLCKCDVTGSCRAMSSSWNSSSSNSSNWHCLTALMRVLDVRTWSVTTPTVDVLLPMFLCLHLATLHGSAFCAIRKCKYKRYFNH